MLISAFYPPYAFYPPSAFSYPRFILHPHFLIRGLSSIRIFSSVFSHPPSVSAIRIRVLSLPIFIHIHTYICYSAHSPLGLFSGRLHQVLRLLLTYKLAIFTTIEVYFHSCVYPYTPCQLPCGRKPECPEKTHDFRQSVD